MTSGTTRKAIRYAAVMLAALTALVYLLIGAQVLTVLDTPANQYFGFFAAAAYGLGAVLLFAVDRRPIWTLGALFQIFVITMYFNVAGQRSPAFEFWGVALRVPQLLLLIALAYLAIRPRTSQIPFSADRSPHSAVSQ
ncbi:MAG: hypothetical protein U0670_02080 [Anaerolineae bacterium]